MSLKESLNELKDIDFADLDIQQIGVWPVALKAILIILIPLIIVTLGYFLKVREISELTERAVAQEAVLFKQYQEKAFLAANLDAYREQMIELDKTFGALLKQLPKDTEVPGLLEDITAVAYGSGLVMKSISLQPEKVTEFYVELPIKIDVTGDYHDFGSFVSGVASLPRIVTLHDYVVDQAEGSQLNMQIDAKTYRYKAEAEQ